MSEPHATAAPVGRWGLVAGVAALVLLVDQLTKRWALDALADGNVISVFWTLQFQLAHNTGAAFSMGYESGWVRYLPLIVLVVVLAVTWKSRHHVSRTGAVALGMIIGGAVGNLADRLLRADGAGFLAGGVVDFIDFQWWPVFNVADMGVVVGGILFAVVSMVQSRAEDEGESPGTASTTGDGGVGEASTTGEQQPAHPAP